LTKGRALAVRALCDPRANPAESGNGEIANLSHPGRAGRIAPGAAGLGGVDYSPLEPGCASSRITHDWKNDFLKKGAEKNTMSSIRILVVSATILGGLLAGLAVDKSVVQFPSWQQIGPVAWAEFTRAADLRRGLILYPAQGIAALLCSVVAAGAFAVKRAGPREAAIPIYGAAALAILALIVTRYIIAPVMFSLRNLGENTTDLQKVFDHVQAWWTVKASLHVLTFCANVWALVALGGRR
jgi:hypothetical protein